VDDYLNVKNNLRGKWYKNYINLLDREILISIVLSNLLPVAIRNKSNNRIINVTSLLQRIGKSIINNILTIE
jgi:hypothetical protein